MNDKQSTSHDLQVVRARTAATASEIVPSSPVPREQGHPHDIPSDPLGALTGLVRHVIQGAGECHNMSAAE